MNIDVELYPANQGLVEYQPGFPRRFVPPTLMPVLSHLHCCGYLIFVSRYYGCISHHLEGKVIRELLLV